MIEKEVNVAIYLLLLYRQVCMFHSPHFVCQFLVIANIKIWLLGIVSI